MIVHEYVRVNWGPQRALCVAVVGVSALMAATLTACAPAKEVTPSPAGAYGEVFTLIRETAVANGASEEQLAELDRYADGGEIPFAVVSNAMDRTFACLDVKGISYASEVYEIYPGYPVYDYSWSVPEGLTAEEARDLGDVCGDRESAFISSLYEQQAGFLEQRDALFESMRPDLLQCLHDHGVTVEDDATRDEMTQLAVELLRSGVVSEPTCLPPQ